MYAEMKPRFEKIAFYPYYISVVTRAGRRTNWSLVNKNPKRS